MKTPPGASDIPCMTYLKLDSERLLALVDGLNRLAAKAGDPEAVAEVGAQIAGNLTNASGAWVRSGHAGRPAQVGWGDQEGAGVVLSVPLDHAGEQVGQLALVKRGDEPFSEGDHEATRLLAVSLAAHLVHAAAYQQATVESRVDLLTGLGNNMAFMERLEWELSRSSRYVEKLSLAVFEVDDLPAILERFGAPEADSILVEIAEVLSRGRAADSCYRTESDTFMVTMPNTDIQGAEIAAIRMAWEIAQIHGGGGTVTASTGVAEAEVPDARELVTGAMTGLRMTKQPAAR